MSNSLYDFSIPPMVRALGNVSSILDKAAAYADSKKIEPGVLTELRLFPDMYPLVRQVQVACDTAKGAAARLAGIDPPKHADTEKTVEELKARIAKTVDFLNSVSAAQMTGDDNRMVELKSPNGSWKFTAVGYLNDFVLPNFYFHTSMAYALLRKGGVAIGKGDFLGAIQ